MGKLFSLIFLVISVATAYVAFQMFKDQEATDIPDHFWGPASKKGQKEDTSIRPFKINIDEKILTDLKNRLKVELTENRLTTPLEGIGFEYGFNNKYLKTVGQYWLDKYDWKQRETLLNRFPHFKTEIDGIDVHFIHVKSSNNKKYKITRPMLLVHGWPGSFIEFNKMIPMLTDPKDSDINFELVVPSLPGYGFSSAASHPGLGTTETGKIFLKLMKRLGHNQFYAQGGDWGSVVTTNMATLYPKNVLGLHLNSCASMHPRANLRRMIASFYPQMFMSAEEEKMYFPFSKLFSLIIRETGYMHLQWSKPDTVGVGLSNSPLGLAAYILEKFSTWTNDGYWTKEDGALTAKFNLDELLDNIMLYWVTNTITTSVRYYSEAFSSTSMGLGGVPTKVPTGCFAPKYEFFNMPEFFLHDKYPQLVRYTRGDDGGHFTAFEIPEKLAKDVIALFSHIEKSGLANFNKKL